MLKKNLLFALVFVFCFSLIEAQPIFKQNTNISLNVPCTINGALCSGSAACNSSIISPSGVVLANNQLMMQNNGLFNINLTANQTTENGEYEFPVTCCDTGVCATRNLKFFITPSGIISTNGESLIYSILILIVVFFFALCLFGAFKVRSSNNYDFGGKLLKITYGKYLKMFLFWLSIVFLWVLFFLGWQVSDKVLMFDFIGMVFHTSFTVLTYLIAPCFLAFVVLALLQWTADLELWKLNIRHLKPR